VFKINNFLNFSSLIRKQKKFFGFCGKFLLFKPPLLLGAPPPPLAPSPLASTTWCVCDWEVCSSDKSRWRHKCARKRHEREGQGYSTFPVAVRCSALQCVAVNCRVLQCATLCCRVMQCAAVCCIMDARARATSVTSTAWSWFEYCISTYGVVSALV